MHLKRPRVKTKIKIFDFFCWKFSIFFENFEIFHFWKTHKKSNFCPNCTRVRAFERWDPGAIDARWIIAFQAKLRILQLLKMTHFWKNLGFIEIFDILDFSNHRKRCTWEWIPWWSSRPAVGRNQCCFSVMEWQTGYLLPPHRRYSWRSSF